ncbi:hypothetical protein PCE1_002216 [Barthelona sp. PCE]
MPRVARRTHVFNAGLSCPVVFGAAVGSVQMNSGSSFTLDEVCDKSNVSIDLEHEISIPISDPVPQGCIFTRFMFLPRTFALTHVSDHKTLFNVIFERKDGATVRYSCTLYFSNINNVCLWLDYDLYLSMSSRTGVCVASVENGTILTLFNYKNAIYLGFVNEHIFFVIEGKICFIELTQSIIQDLECPELSILCDYDVDASYTFFSQYIVVFTPSKLVLYVCIGPYVFEQYILIQDQAFPELCKFDASNFSVLLKDLDPQALTFTAILVPHGGSYASFIRYNGSEFSKTTGFTPLAPFTIMCLEDQILMFDVLPNRLLIYDRWVSDPHLWIPQKSHRILYGTVLIQATSRGMVKFDINNNTYQCFIISKPDTSNFLDPPIRILKDCVVWEYQHFLDEKGVTICTFEGEMFRTVLPIRATLLGISDEGALMIQYEDGTVEFDSETFTAVKLPPLHSIVEDGYYLAEPGMECLYCVSEDRLKVKKHTTRFQQYFNPFDPSMVLMVLGGTRCLIVGDVSPNCAVTGKFLCFISKNLIALSTGIYNMSISQENKLIFAFDDCFGAEQIEVILREPKLMSVFDSKLYVLIPSVDNFGYATYCFDCISDEKVVYSCSTIDLREWLSQAVPC